MIIRLTLVILFISMISTFYLQRELNQQLKNQILTYSATKTQNEKLYYAKADDNMHLITNSISQDFSIKKTNTFSTPLVQQNDGSRRSKKELLNYKKHAGIFIPKHVVITNEYLNELATVENVFNKFAAAFFKNYFQLWYVSSKSGYVSYLPSTNRHLYETPGDFDDTNEFYYKISKEELNPDRKKVWTRVYEDTNYKRWMISLVAPIYIDDIHMGTIGLDFLLEDLISRIQNEHDIGLSNYIIDQVGHIIGHHQYTQDIKKANGNLSIIDTKNPILLEIFEKLSLVSSLNESIILDLKSTKNHIGVSKLTSPPWYIITEQDPLYYTNTLLSLLKMAIGIAVFSLVLEIFIVYRYIKKEVVIPIKKLTENITAHTSSNFELPLQNELKNEIGVIQNSYNELISMIISQEKEITEYQNLLEEKVSVRTMELNQALRLADEAKTKAIYTEKMASLGELASGIAHEINNPLTIIQLNLTTLDKMLQKEIIDEEKAFRAVNKIDSISDRILEIIKGLNQYTDVNYDPIQKHEDVLKIITQSVELMSDKIQSNNVIVNVDMAESFKITCIETQMVQVFTNLISNAIDAIENRAEDDRWIKIWCDKNQHSLFIYIQDSGDGIPDSILQKMLTPFFTTKEIGKGTGLGLSIIRSIIEKHHGSIQYDTTRAKTTFVVKMPLTNSNEDQL